MDFARRYMYEYSSLKLLAYAAFSSRFRMFIELQAITLELLELQAFMILS